MGRRIGAFLIDALIGTAILVLVMASTFTNTSFDNDLTAELQCQVINELSEDLCIAVGSTVFVGTAAETGILLLAWVGAVILLCMIVPGFTGSSPGKLMLGLRIVDKDTFELAGMGKNIGRGFMWIADAFPYIFPLVGLVAGLSTRGHRRVGDLVAGTLVVMADQVGRPVALAGVNNLGSAAAVPVGQTFQPTGPPTAPPPPGAAPLTPPPPPGATTTPPPPPGAATPPPPPPGAATQPPPPTPSEQPFDVPPPSAAQDPSVEDHVPFAVAPMPDHAQPKPVAEEPRASTSEPVGASPVPPPPPAPAPEPVAEPEPVAQPGVGAPVWDDARDTYIQWDPDINAWMMWSEASAQWVPISS